MSRPKSWSPPNATAPEPERPADAATPGGTGGGRELCGLCDGTQWVAIPDPLFNGALVDSRCPACCDLSVRAAKTCWENNWGGRVGPP